MCGCISVAWEMACFITRANNVNGVKQWRPPLITLQLLAINLEITWQGQGDVSDEEAGSPGLAQKTLSRLFTRSLVSTEIASARRLIPCIR